MSREQAKSKVHRTTMMGEQRMSTLPRAGPPGSGANSKSRGRLSQNQRGRGPGRTHALTAGDRATREGLWGWAQGQGEGTACANPPSLTAAPTGGGGSHRPHHVSGCPSECHERPLHVFAPSELPWSPEYICACPGTPTCPLSMLTHPS